ncbi:unnamed protein product [Prunus brigantina]
MDHVTSSECLKLDSQSEVLNKDGGGKDLFSQVMVPLNCNTPIIGMLFPFLLIQGPRLSLQDPYYKYQAKDHAQGSNTKNQKPPTEQLIFLSSVAGFDTWVWHAFFGVAESQNDLNVLGQSPVFNDVLKGEALNITNEINNTVHQNGYYLADGIYPRWTTFRCFGILQA